MQHTESVWDVSEMNEVLSRDAIHFCRRETKECSTVAHMLDEDHWWFAEHPCTFEEWYHIDGFVDCHCYNFTSFSVPLLFSILTLPIYGYLFFSFFSFLILSDYSYTLTHVQHDSHMLAHVLIHAQLCLLMCLLMRSSAYSYAYSYAYSAYSYAYSAYSYTVVVQNIRTGWTPLFSS